MTDVKKRIVVVDDSDEVREFSTLLLEGAGYAVVTAATGAAGFEKVRSERPDLVLLDIVMPGMDGFELLLRLRSDLSPPIPPVILVSGFDVTEEEALRRGAVRFVRKPFDPDDLLALVADVLAGRRPSAERIAAERARVGAARQRAREIARTLLENIEAHTPKTVTTLNRVASAHLSFLAHYFGVEGAAFAVLRGDRLLVEAASESSLLAPGSDLGELLPPSHEVLSTGSSLVLPDLTAHPSFSPLSGRLHGIRCFVGVPVVVEQVAIGVVCVFGSRCCVFEAEDMSIVQLFCRIFSSALGAWAAGRPEAQWIARFGPGITVRLTFEQTLDAELRLLALQGGSMELAVLDIPAVAAVREALLHATVRDRLLGGVLSEGRVAMYKRGRNGVTRRDFEVLLGTLRSTAEVRAVGAVGLEASGLHAFAARDLVRIAELELEKTLEAGGGGLRRLSIQEDVTPL